MEGDRLGAAPGGPEPGGGCAPARGSFAAGQLVTVFRSRLRPGSEAAYHLHAARVAELAGRAPGLVDFKTFEAADGERVTVVTFADESSQLAWSLEPDHFAAQRAGRDSYYEHYSVQVCRAERVTDFVAPPGVDGHTGD